MSTNESSIESATGQANEPVAMSSQIHVCSVCGEVGHNKRSCPVNAPPMGHTELDALLIDLRSQKEALLFVPPNGFEIIPEPFLGQSITEYSLDVEDDPS